MRGMRTLVAGFVVLLVALGLAALPILMTGKAALVTLAAGHPVLSPRTTTIAAAVAAGFAALCVILQAAARLRPRKYFQLVAWSRYSMLVAVSSLAFAAISVVWRQMVYGLGT